jgi:hypothetical protein
MRNSNLPLNRLLCAAAATKNDRPNEMPYGFDTRLFAQLRAQEENDLVALGRLLRRVVLLSLGVIVLAGAGAYHESLQNDDLGDSLTDEYVIADSVIGSAFEQ